MSSTAGPRAATFLLGTRAGRVSCWSPETPACELTLIHRPMSTGVTRCAFLREKPLPGEPDVRVSAERAVLQDTASKRETDVTSARCRTSSTRRKRQLLPAGLPVLVFPGGGRGWGAGAGTPAHGSSSSDSDECHASPGTGPWVQPEVLVAPRPPRSWSHHCWPGFRPVLPWLAWPACCPAHPQAQEHGPGTREARQEHRGLNGS